LTDNQRIGEKSKHFQPLASKQAMPPGVLKGYCPHTERPGRCLHRSQSLQEIALNVAAQGYLIKGFSGGPLSAEKRYQGFSCRA
jgi:hypothetical protein